MVAQQHSPDDIIDLMVAHAVALRSGQPPDRDAFEQTLRWAQRRGYFRPARNVLDNPVTHIMLLEALEGRTKTWRREERQEAVREALHRAHFYRVAPQPSGRPTPDGTPQGAQNRPITHVLDRYRMSIAGREVSLGDMTHFDWERVREQHRNAVAGQAAAFARPELVDTLALRKGARLDQRYREVVTNDEAREVFACAERVGRDTAGGMDAHIATIVATNPLFRRPGP